MIDTIYLERDASTHPRARALLARFADARVIECDAYGEVFNPGAQSFRLQKRRPALILARKHGNLVLAAPEGFGIGGTHNYYFSHMLNCLYDCRYCFLQGMFRSAHYVLFVNFDDFERAIDEVRDRHAPERCTFFSGYDCDSLALESISGFVERFVPFFAARPDAVLELRTKSVAIGALERHTPVDNVVVAFSFTPAPAAAAVEHGAPDVASRLDAVARLAAAGWPVALRLDPLLWYDGWRSDYQALVALLAERVPAEALHSVSVGPLRFPRRMFHRIAAMYPDDALLAGPLRRRGDLVSYGEAREAEIGDHVRACLADVFPRTPLFSCAAPGS